MEKEEILKLFLRKGAQLDPAALDYLFHNQTAIDFIAKKITENHVPSTITIEFINKVSSPRSNIEIVKQKQREKEKVSVEDVSNFLNNRYAAVKKTLEIRPDMVNLSSINKISAASKKFSIIAMVKEKNCEEAQVLVEDGSGETALYFDDASHLDELVVNDVAGFVCSREGDKIKVEATIWPDIPLRRTAAATEEEIYCLFVSDVLFENENFKKESFEKFLDWANKLQYDNLYIFVLGGISDRKELIKNFFEKMPKDAVKIFMKNKMDADTDAGISVSSPCFLKIGEVALLLVNDDFLSQYQKIWKEEAPRVLLRLLRRRVLNPNMDCNEAVFKNDPFFINPIPDIVVAGNVFDAGELNYKTVSILTNGSFIHRPIFWMVNLKTREIIKLDFT